MTLDEVLGAVYRKETATLEGLTPAELAMRDGDGRTPLMHAVLDSDARPAVIRVMLARGAAVNAGDARGATALHFVASLGQTHLVTLLLDAGAEIDPAGPHGNTPLFEAAMRPKANAATIAELVRRGADPRIPNRNGIAPIELATQTANVDLRALLEGGPIPVPASAERVRHPTFGDGHILRRLDGDKLEIEFANGRKTLLAKFVTPVG